MSVHCLYVIVSVNQLMDVSQLKDLQLQSDVCIPLRQGPHRQVGVDSVMTSGRPSGVMVRTPAQKARDVGSFSCA